MRCLLLVAVALLVAPAAASAVPIRVNPPTTSVLESAARANGAIRVQFGSSTAVAGSVAVFASRDAALDAADPKVADAVFGVTSGFSALAQFSLDDRVINAGGKTTWWLFYVATQGLELAASQSEVTVLDDDLNRQPSLGQLMILRGRTLDVPVIFPDAGTDVSVTVRYCGKTVARIRLKPTSTSTLSVKLRVSASTQRLMKRRRGSVLMTVTGTSPLRDISTSKTVALGFST